jgi:hypothetical protein
LRNILGFIFKRTTTNHENELRLLALRITLERAGSYERARLLAEHQVLSEIHPADKAEAEYPDIFAEARKRDILGDLPCDILIGVGYDDELVDDQLELGL